MFNILKPNEEIEVKFKHHLDLWQDPTIPSLKSPVSRGSLRSPVLRHLLVFRVALNVGAGFRIWV